MIPALLPLNALAAPAPAPTLQERDIKAWMQGRVGDPASGSQYILVLADLNGDRAPEALVYLSGRDWCGSGGCQLYILQWGGGSWRLVNSVTVANPPVRVLATRSRGWSDIGVRVGGGGSPAYEAVLRFNGLRYPGNPTMPPAFRAPPGTAGRTVISPDSDAKPLFP